MTRSSSTSQDPWSPEAPKPRRDTRFQPGQSGNPEGRPRKQPASRPDLKSTLEQALNETTEIRDGGRVRRISLGALGIQQLVRGHAKGDRHARRDLMILADRLGIDLAGSSRTTIEEALAPPQQAILDRYVERRSAEKAAAAKVVDLALLDDPPTDDK